MSATHLHSRLLPTPAPPNANFGHGTAFLRVPGTSAVLFGWVEGVAKAQLARWDLASGAWERIRALGLPRDALFDGERATVLTTHGLHELRLQPLSSVLERTEGVPDWGLRLQAIPGAREALISKRHGRTCVRIGLDGGGGERVMGPAPELLLRRDDEVVALSFARGVGYSLERPRSRFDIPRASAAIALGGRVFIAPGVEGPARNVSPPMHTDEVFDIYSDGKIVEFSLDRGVGEVLVELASPIHGLHGPTRSGHLLASTERGLFWIDVARRETVALEPKVRGAVCVIDDLVLVAPSAADRPARILGVGDEAAHMLAALVPPAPEPPSPARLKKVARAREEGVIACEEYRRAHLSGIVGPAHFRECEFHHCRLGDPAAATEARNVTLEHCTIAGGAIHHAKLTDCRFERIHLRGSWHALDGIDLERVTLAGNFDGHLVIQNPPPQMLARRGPEAWALDISRGRFTGLELRGVPSRLVRRDPETQVVVRRERAEDRRWEKLPIGAYSIPLAALLQGEVEDVVLVAPTRGRRSAEAIEALRLLRAEGIAEPD